MSDLRSILGVRPELMRAAGIAQYRDNEITAH